MTISESEILAALRKAMEQRTGEPGEFTTLELAERMGIGPERVKGTLKKLIASGLAVTGRAHRMSMDGVSRPVPVYRLVLKKGTAVPKKRT